MTLTTSQTLHRVPWHKWVGLPHRLGADPRDGEACCCLELWFAVADGVEIHIAEKDHLRMLARENEPDGDGICHRMDQIAIAATDLTRPIPSAAVTTADIAIVYGQRRGDPPVGVVVAIDDVALTMTHTTGLRAVLRDRMPAHWGWRSYSVRSLGPEGMS